MDKKLINEDIKNMKYLFGYKPGRVISEQDFDYTTDDYLDTTEMDEEGKRHPERLVKHKDTGNIVGTHKHEKGFRPNRHGEELGFEFHSTDIPHGTKFGGTEVGDFDYSLFSDDGELDEDIFAGWDEPDNFKSIKITKDDDLNVDVEETTKSILNKYNLLNEAQDITKNYVMFRNKSSEVTQKVLSILHLLTKLEFLGIVDCEFTDFSDVNICNMSKLTFINLHNTKHNFNEQGFECVSVDENDENFYIID